VRPFGAAFTQSTLVRGLLRLPPAMLGKQRVIVGIRASSQDELGLIGGLVVDRAEVRLDDDDLVTSQFDGKKRVRLLQDSSSLRGSQPRRHPRPLAVGELDATLLPLTGTPICREPPQPGFGGGVTSFS
jgi:hypothetical protein